MTRTEDALLTLNAMIDDGREFPDVVGVVARQYRIKVETLTRAYDAQGDAFYGIRDGSTAGYEGDE